MRTLLLLILTGLAANADLVRHTGDAAVRGRLTAIEAGHFVIVTASNETVRLPAATVTGVDFDSGAVPARLETGAEVLDGMVWTLTRGVFHLDKPGGETVRVPATRVVRASFRRPVPVASPPPRAAVPALAKSQLIARAEPVELTAHLPAGKVTVVDFYAEWCGPCRQLAPWLENFVAGDPDVVLRKVDIVGWQSPVARQYQIRGVPHLQIYDRHGRKVGEMTGFHEPEFRALIQKAKSS